jgi:hypothetical protein
LEEAVLTYQNEARDELGKFREEFNRLGASVVGDIARVDRVTTFTLPMEVFWSKTQQWMVEDRKGR